MQRRLVALVAMAAAACSSASGGVSSDAGKDAAEDYGQPICILQEGGSTYDCNGQTVPACPASAESAGATCTAPMAQCTGCEGQTPPNGLGAGFSCTCQDGGPDAGLEWSCTGTEHLCK